MSVWPLSSLSFETIRPLVRYVDDQQAVLDIHVKLRTDLDDPGPAPVGMRIPLHMQLIGPSGETHTHLVTIALRGAAGFARISVPHPQRWWPAGMGEQVLYELCVSLMHDEEQVIDTWRITLGMTSVRKPVGDNRPSFLVNGRSCPIREIVAVDPDAESEVLPIAGNSLLIVREHFAPDVLFEAADRAGILLVQSVPMRLVRERRSFMTRQVDRLAGHPSLAGWLIERADRLADRLARRLRQLDPTRGVYRRLPA